MAIRPRLESALPLAATGAGVFGGLIGVVVLTGWSLNVSALQSCFVGSALVHPGVALGIVLSALSLVTLAPCPPGRLQPLRWLGQASAVLALVLSAEGLIERFAGWDLGVGELVGSFLAHRDAGSPGPMPLDSASVLLVVGLALLLLDARTASGRRPAPAMSLAAAVPAMFSIAEWVYGSRVTAEIAQPSHVALAGALALLALAAGAAAARPAPAWLALATSDTDGARLARRLLPVVLVLPLVAGWLRIEGQALGLYGTLFGITVLATFSMVVLIVIVYWNARALHESSLRRLQAEQELSHSEARYRTLAEAAQDHIFIVNRDYRVEYVNEYGAAAFGTTPPQMKGRHLDGLLHVDEASQRRESLQAVFDGGAPLYSEDLFSFPGRRVWLGTRLVPLKDARGETTAVLGIARDITERKALEEQLRLAQRLEAVGRLAGGVAHDFNNLLTAITGYAEFLLEGIRDGTARQSDVEEIRKAADRAAALVRQLLAFGRKQVMQPRVLNLNAVLGDLTPMLSRLIGEHVKLSITCAPDLWPATADQGQMEQIIANLVTNARDAMPGGGLITVETANATLDETFVREHVGSRAGPHARLTVSDTGRGMDQETQRHIFEPFFTTKRLGEGTGLGLATVYGIVKQSGGSIWVESEVGRGSAFSVYLPRSG